MSPSSHPQIWLAAGVRTPFAKIDGPLAGLDAIALSVPLAEYMLGVLDGALPDLAAEEVYWRLHFALGMMHNNRFAEFDRLHVLSEGAARESDTEALLKRMVDFAEAGFLA